MTETAFALFGILLGGVLVLAWVVLRAESAEARYRERMARDAADMNRKMNEWLRRDLEAKK